MQTYTTHYQFSFLKMPDENNSNKNETSSYSFSHKNCKNCNPENKSDKPETTAEKNTKLMQKIWGDNFLSDSLH